MYGFDETQLTDNNLVVGDVYQWRHDHNVLCTVCLSDCFDDQVVMQVYAPGKDSHGKSFGRDNGQTIAKNFTRVGTRCEECGTIGDYYEGLCYECQCTGHAQGWFDMDGEGYKA